VRRQSEATTALYFPLPLGGDKGEGFSWNLRPSPFPLPKGEGNDPERVYLLLPLLASLLELWFTFIDERFVRFAIIWMLHADGLRLRF
jgi:hypothetical protein